MVLRRPPRFPSYEETFPTKPAPAKPDLPKFDVKKLERAWSGVVGFRASLSAVAEEAVRQYLNPPKDPVEVLAEKIGALWLDFTNEADAASIVARHILETYPDAHERL